MWSTSEKNSNRRISFSPSSLAAEREVSSTTAIHQNFHQESSIVFIIIWEELSSNQLKLTNWIKVIAFQDIKTSTIITAVRTNWISRFGAPQEIISNAGSKFIWTTCKDFLLFLGLKNKSLNALLHTKFWLCYDQIMKCHKGIFTRIIAEIVFGQTLTFLSNFSLKLIPTIFFMTSFHKCVVTNQKNNQALHVIIDCVKAASLFILLLTTNLFASMTKLF